MIPKIDSITIGIAVANVQQATEWYKSLLGNVEMMEPAPGTVELKLTENAWLQLDDTGYLPAGTSILRFETKDLKAAHKLVGTLSTDVGAIEAVEGVVEYFDFKDPSGNRLSFVQLL